MPAQPRAKRVTLPPLHALDALLPLCEVQLPQQPNAEDGAAAAMECHVVRHRHAQLLLLALIGEHLQRSRKHQRKA